MIAHAQQTLNDVIGIFSTGVRMLIPIALALALLFFIWGLAKFIWNSGDEKALETGRNIMLWGTVTLFVLVSIWGIVTFFAESFGITQGGLCPPPSINSNGVSSGCL